MTTLASTLAAAKARGRAALILYFPVGFPTPDATIPLLDVAQRAGVDAVELGVPFSDPLAEGPTIQRAMNIALRNGVRLSTCLDTVQAARHYGITMPLLLMGYFNPIHRYGVTAFATDAAAVGVDGCIVPDLPPEEAGPLASALKAVGIPLIPMVAPTSTDERIALATAQGAGFVYCVSVTGVTGARRELPDDLATYIARVRAHTDLPIGVGFGISERRHLDEVGRVADIAIVGSAVVERIGAATTVGATTALRAFLAELRGA
ncbi:MAG: tryptophan synthase subunit alpha [Dehalococcoidia bacterium]|nr:tryptophan synthase subunit alpha [Dehalococcoidia bacterium]